MLCEDGELLLELSIGFAMFTLFLDTEILDLDK